MRISFKKLILWGMCLCLILETRFYNIPILSFLGAVNSNYVCAALYVVMWLMCINNKHIRSVIRPYTRFINKFLLIIFGLLTLHILYSLAFSTQSTRTVLDAVLVYFKLLAIYPLIYLLVSYEDKTISKVMLCIVGIMMIYCTYAAFVFNTSGKVVSEALLDTDYIRNDNIRIRSIALFWVFALLAFNEMLSCHKMRQRILYGFLAAFGILYIALVNQSRAQTIAATAMIVGMFLFKKKRGRVQLVTIILAMAAAGIYFSSDSFSSLLYSFSVNSAGNSTSIRITILNSLMGAVERMPLGYLMGCGLGSTITVDGTEIYFLDLGLIGDLLNTGILAFALYVGMLGRMYGTFRAIRYKDERGHTFVLGCIFFILFGAAGFTLNPATRFMAIPVIMAYEEYYRNRNRLNKKTDDKIGKNISKGKVRL